MPIARPTCEDCGQGVDPSKPGQWTLVTGWVQTRGKGGGTHAITDQKSLGQFLCDPCMMDRKWAKKHQAEKLF